MADYYEHMFVDDLPKFLRNLPRDARVVSHCPVPAIGSMSDAFFASFFDVKEAPPQWSVILLIRAE